MTEHLEPPQVNSSSKLERHTFWRDVFRRYEASGLQRRPFCKRHNLKLTDFDRWRHYLKHLDSKTSVNQKKSISKKSKKQSKPNQPLSAKFIEVAMTHSVSSEINNSTLRILTKTGLEVWVSDQFNPQTLYRLLQVIGGTTC